MPLNHRIGFSFINYLLTYVLGKLSNWKHYSSVLNCDTVGNRHTVGTFQIINKHTV